MSTTMSSEEAVLRSIASRLKDGWRSEGDMCRAVARAEEAVDTRPHFGPRTDSRRLLDTLVSAQLVLRRGMVPYGEYRVNPNPPLHRPDSWKMRFAADEQAAFEREREEREVAAREESVARLNAPVFREQRRFIAEIVTEANRPLVERLDRLEAALAEHRPFETVP